MLSGSTDLNEMALGNCTSACSVWGAVGGVPVLGVKDAYGNTVLSVLEGFRQGTPLPFANLDAEFLDAVDTGAAFPTAPGFWRRCRRRSCPYLADVG